MPSENHIGFMQGSSRPLWTAAALLLASCALFLTLDAGGNWDFVLPLRLGKLAALLTVAYAVGVSTMLFQTLTNNPILTPSASIRCTSFCRRCSCSPSAARVIRSCRRRASSASNWLR